MAQRVFQPNFTGGILGEDMYARSDTSKYVIGVADAVNMLIRPQGGMQNRAGFRLASGFDTGTEDRTQWLIPFTLTPERSVMLEFTESVAHVIEAGAYVLDETFTPQGVVAIDEAAEAVIEMASPAAAAEFSAGELVFLSDPAGDHVLGEQVLRVVSVTDEFIAFEVFDWTRFDTSAGAAFFGVIGAGATLTKLYSFAHPYDLADVPFVRFAQDNVDMYFAHPDYPVQKLTFTGINDWAMAPFVFEPGVGAPGYSEPFDKTVTAVTQADPAVVTSAGHGLADGTTGYMTGVSGMTQINDKYYVVRNPTDDTFELEDSDGSPVDSTGFGAFSGTATFKTMFARPDGNASGTDYKYKISALAADTLEEGLPSDPIEVTGDVPTVDNILNWQAVEGAALYNIYKLVPAGYAYIGTTANTTFSDTNIEPDSAITPSTVRNPFENGRYPKLVSFAEQRLTFAAPDEDPQVLELSKVAAFQNFTISYPSKPDDALRFRLRTRQLNQIRGLVSGRALLVFTSSTEWIVTGNEQEGVLTPTSIVPRPESYWGSYDIEPITVGDVAMFVEPSGNTIRDFLLTLNQNAEDQSRDLTILVRDLFEDLEITSWCYTKAPDRMVWVTLSDGSLLSLCYMREHDIWGWTRHEIGGINSYVYQVAEITEGARDVLYAVIGRQTPAGEVIMTERLEQRWDYDVEEAYFVDAGLTYDDPGQPASILSGLLHLRGQTVQALVNGSVVEDLVVDGAGKVDLGDVSGDLIHIGLRYTALVKTLPTDFEVEGLGSMQGRFKAVGEVALNVKRSRGLAVGIREDSLNELIEWEPSMVGGPIPLFTGTININPDGDWVRDATLLVVQRYPLPFTLLGVAPIWETGE